MSFIPYPPSVYNLDYDRVKELSNRIYIQREEFRKNLDKLHALRTTVKNLTKDIKNLVSLKYLCETLENPDFLRNDKMVISVKIRKFF